MADGDCTLSLQRDLKKNEFHKQPDFKSSVISLHLLQNISYQMPPSSCFSLWKGQAINKSTKAGGN